MLTDFQKKKMALLLNFWDGNNNGYLDEGDYLRIAQRLCEERGFAEGSPEAEQVYGVLRADWAEASHFADQDNDNRITLEEWTVFCDTFIHNADMYVVTVTKVRDAVLDAVDTDGDGVLNVNDWRNVFKIYSWKEEAAESTFARMDKDNDGKLSRDELGAALDVFFKSDDENEAGNYMFGLLDN